MDSKKVSNTQNLILNINIFAPDKSQYTKGKEYLSFNLYLNKILTQSEIIGKMGV